MSMEIKSDQRRYARFEILDYATVTGGSAGASDTAMVVDVGLGGLQLRWKNPGEVGDAIVISIGRNGAEPLDIQVQVTNKRQIEADLWAVGCRFLPGSHEQRVAVAEYVHNVFQRQGERLVS